MALNMDSVALDGTNGRFGNLPLPGRVGALAREPQTGPPQVTPPERGQFAGKRRPSQPAAACRCVDGAGHCRAQLRGGPQWDLSALPAHSGPSMASRNQAVSVARVCASDSRPRKNGHHRSSRPGRAKFGGRFWILGLNGSNRTGQLTAGGILGVGGCLLIGDRSNGGRNAGSDRESALVSRSIFAPTTWLWFVYYFTCCAKYRSFGFVQSGTVRVSTTGAR
ncbi:hypothetical protein D3C85_774860 [compost metagenome]